MKKCDNDIKKESVKHDEKTLQELFNLYYSSLCIISFKYVNDFAQAEDLVQDVFIKFWDKRKWQNSDTCIKSYLYASVKNESLSYIKKNKKRLNVNLDVLDELEDEMECDDEFSLLRNKKILDELNKLPERRRRIFIDIALNRYKYKEVADNLGISLNTVKTQYARSLKWLRKHIEIILIIFVDM